MPALPNAPLATLETKGLTRRQRPVDALRVWAGWLARHRSRKHLAQLDAHMLRDIGLSEHSASTEVCKPFWRD